MRSLFKCINDWTDTCCCLFFLSSSSVVLAKKSLSWRDRRTNRMKATTTTVQNYMKKCHRTRRLIFGQFFFYSLHDHNYIAENDGNDIVQHCCWEATWSRNERNQRRPNHINWNNNARREIEWEKVGGLVRGKNRKPRISVLSLNEALYRHYYIRWLGPFGSWLMTMNKCIYRFGFFFLRSSISLISSFL